MKAINQYHVEYTIETDAKNPLDAALIVEQYMKGGYYRPVLIVTNMETGEQTTIDLEDQEPQQ